MYGLQQGLGNAWFFQARDYYLKDVLDLSPAQAQAYHSATYTPWSSKYTLLRVPITINLLSYVPNSLHTLLLQSSPSMA